jgi:hypothetical protein
VGEIIAPEQRLDTSSVGQCLGITFHVGTIRNLISDLRDKSGANLV